ncbi:MAG: LytTR family transcriptional regulator [Gammaproteobacteria bacterium]|nr:LytTR family transcriptional regulator [Gammaproteobacteria bacterium]
MTTQPLAARWDTAGAMQPGPARAPRGRKPARKDYVLFLVVVPLLISLWIAALGIRPVNELGFAGGWLYLGSRTLVAWWGGHFGALAAAYIVRQRNWALWRILLLGFCIAWLPLTVLFHAHLLVFSTLYPDHVASLSLREMTFTADYLLRLFSRSAVPFLPLWMAAVHAYRRQFGVDWYAGRGDVPAAQPERPAASGVEAPAVAVTHAVIAPPVVPALARPAFLQQSKLPENARVQTLKAAEHYIEVVSDCGSDRLRYRFNDAIREMQALGTGGQVHRSWWVSWDSVARMVQRGSGLELVLHDGRSIPVSQAYKSEVRRRCSGREQP